jgi:hypothetical protein
MIGHIRPLNGDRAVLELHLRLDRLARHDLFLFHAMPGHAPEGTRLARPVGRV